MSAFKRSLVAIVAVAASSMASQAQADQVLDQNSPNWVPHLFCGQGCEWQQEVTAGISGQLTGLTLFTSGTAEVRIGIGSGFYSGPWLADLLAPIDGSIIDLSAYNIVMTAGTKFVIDVTPTPSSEQYPIGGMNPSQYAGGNLWSNFVGSANPVSSGGSMAFTTYVTAVPEPASAASLFVGLIALSAALRRGKRRPGLATGLS